MRPQRLVARGFAAFRDEIELDFTDTDFFALVGPTGSGKSSVIDAICFALYGSVPRYEDERVVTPAITTDATEARVELDFVSDGIAYRVVRVVRRKGAPKVQLDRLAGDGELAEALTSAVREAKQLVTDIVGLSFDQFTKCVVLPQGAFASFLHAGEAERNKLLTSLLDLGVYDRIATLAGERYARVDAEIAAAEQILGELGPVDDASLKSAAARLAALRALDKQVGEARVEAGALTQRLGEARAALGDAGRAVAALDDVRVAPEVSAIATERDALAIRLRDAEQAHTAARAVVETASAAAAEGLALDERRSIVLAHRRLATLDEARAAATAEHASHGVALEQARTAATQADEALITARAALDECRAAHAAHALAAHLAVGEPCPVCEQVVSTLDGVTSRTKPAAVKQAETRVTKATKAHDAARHAVTDAERHATRVATQLAAHDEQRAELVSAIAPIPDLDAAEQMLAAGEAAAAAADDARKRAVAALDDETAARRALDGFDRQVDTIADNFHRQRDAVAAAGVAAVPMPTGQLATDWTTLREWATSAATEWRGRADLLTATCRDLESSTRAVVDRVTEPATVLGVVLERDLSIDGVRDAVREAGFDARKRHDGLVAARESAAQLQERQAARRSELEVTRALRGHLRTTNFKTWLLTRAVDALAARATDRLLELSGGRYELALGDNDDFEVVDRGNAGERRPVRSLSGGETFEASLALALALAEQVAELSAAGASSLESIFLDEGFGTLDPEALELVAGAVETLGGEGRMVGIVTHVSALAERVPVRFRVANDGRTATITREG